MYRICVSSYLKTKLQSETTARDLKLTKNDFRIDATNFYHINLIMNTCSRCSRGKGMQQIYKKTFCQPLNLLYLIIEFFKFSLFFYNRAWCPSNRNSTNVIPEKVQPVIIRNPPDRRRTMSASGKLQNGSLRATYAKSWGHIPQYHS